MACGVPAPKLGDCALLVGTCVSTLPRAYNRLACTESLKTYHISSIRSDLVSQDLKAEQRCNFCSELRSVPCHFEQVQYDVRADDHEVTAVELIRLPDQIDQILAFDISLANLGQVLPFWFL